MIFTNDKPQRYRILIVPYKLVHKRAKNGRLVLPCQYQNGFIPINRYIYILNWLTQATADAARLAVSTVVVPYCCKRSTISLKNRGVVIENTS